MPSDSIHRMLAYLRACFSWDYTSQSGQNLLAKSIRERYFVPIETLTSGLSSQVRLEHDQIQTLLDKLDKNRRSSNLLYGIFPLTARVEGVRRAESLCTPLLLAELSDHNLRDGDSASLVPRLIVNQIALSRFIDDDLVDEVATDLQALVDAGPMGHDSIRALCHRLAAEVPDLELCGFDQYPLTKTESQVRTLVAGRSAPALVCAAAVYVAGRSRQSMGIIHELGIMEKEQQFSRPVRQLMQGESVQVEEGGPLSVIGALSTAQRKAVLAVRKNSLSVIHGPPGTGKTHVLTMLVADQLSNGKSVLICARSTPATDVIQRFLSEKLNIGEAIVRGGSYSQLRELKAHISQVLQNGCIRFSQLTQESVRVFSQDQPPEQWALSKALKKSARELRRTDRKLSRVATEISQHTDANLVEPGIYFRLSRWARKLIRWPIPPMHIAHILSSWRELHAQRERIVLARLQLQIQQGVVDVLSRQRATVAQFAKSVTAKEHTQRNLQEATDYRVLTRTMPLWISTLSDLSHILPLQCELFDLVIIDEASQADIASAMPALQRARRVAIIGDTKQLRHISFLPREREAAYLSVNEFSKSTAPSYRNDSVLDWVNRQIPSSEACSFLDEHFRSSPEIISFSNHEFYGGQLKLLTHNHRPRGASALSLVQVENGVRGASQHNKREAAVLLQHLRRLVDANDTNRPALTIGVMSPFRAQAEYLQRLVNREFSNSEISRHQLSVGTAYDFQGEERDVVLLSACIDDESHAGSLRFLSRSDVLNVAATRARQRQIVFLSKSLATIDSTTRFGRYIETVHQVSQALADEPLANRRYDQAIDALIAEIDVRECQVSTHVEIGSIVVDILLKHKGRFLGIDLIGFGDGDVRRSLHRHELELLFRLNMEIVPVTVTDWNNARPYVIDYLNRQIRKAMDL